MDGDKKIKVVQLFEENARPCDDKTEDPPCRRMPTIQIINHGNAKIISSDIQINITVSIS